MNKSEFFIDGDTVSLTLSSTELKLIRIALRRYIKQTNAVEAIDLRDDFSEMIRAIEESSSLTSL